MPSDIYDAFRATYNVETFRTVLEHPLVNNLIIVALSLAFILVIVSLFREMYLHVLGDGGSYTSVFIRLIFVGILLGSYISLVFSAIELVDTFALNFVNSAVVKNSFDKSQDIINEDESAIEDEINAILNNEEPKKKSFFSFSWSLPDLSISQLLVQASLFVSQACLFIINAIRNISLTLLSVVGPFAIITLLDRNLQVYGFGWFKSFINVLVWPFLLALVLFAQNILLDNLMTSESFSYKTKMFGYNVVFILYLFKIMKFLPELASGNAGSFSSFEGMLAAGISIASGSLDKAKGVLSKPVKKAGSYTMNAVKGAVAGVSNAVYDSIATRVSTRGMNLDNNTKWVI